MSRKNDSMILKVIQNLLIDKKVFTRQEFLKEYGEEYENHCLAEQAGKMLIQQLKDSAAMAKDIDDD